MLYIIMTQHLIKIELNVFQDKAVSAVAKDLNQLYMLEKLALDDEKN